MVRLLAVVATALLAGQLAHALARAARRVRRPRRRTAAALLEEAGVALHPAAYGAGRLACGLMAFGVAHQVTGAVAVAVPPAVVAASVPRMVLAQRRLRRRAGLQQAWPDGLRDLSASVAAGMSLPQAVQALATSGPEELRPLFARVPALLPALGLPATLERVRASVADPTTDRIIEVLLLAHERGGRMLPALLADLAEATARDVHLHERTVTAQLELRLNARAVFALPWVVLCLLTLRPGPFRAFYASPRAVPVVALGALLSFAGIALVERLARVPVEPRVFPGSGSRP